VGVHAGLEDLERDHAPDRLPLLRHEHDAKAALADLLEQLVAANDAAGPLADGGPWGVMTLWWRKSPD
jgi:hypothetical protein